MSATCKTGSEDCQPFTSSGPIRINIGLPELRRLLQVGRTDAVCYAYIISTVGLNESGKFYHEGSGPNWQGGRITLCTCKHLMRTFREPEDWKNVWIAGFTGRGNIGQTSGGAHWLAYLMRVEHAFRSHAELWQSGKLTNRTLMAKSASNHRLGDIFEPLDSCSGEFKPKCYHKPVKDHSHAKIIRGRGCSSQWHKDVNYLGIAKRRSALLLGDPNHSFLWSEPRIRFKGELSRGQARCWLPHIIANLKD